MQLVERLTELKQFIFELRGAHCGVTLTDLNDAIRVARIAETDQEAFAYVVRQINPVREYCEHGGITGSDEKLHDFVETAEKLLRELAPELAEAVLRPTPAPAIR